MRSLTPGNASAICRTRSYKRTSTDCPHSSLPARRSASASADRHLLMERGRVKGESWSWSNGPGEGPRVPPLAGDDFVLALLAEHARHSSEYNAHRLTESARHRCRGRVRELQRELLQVQEEQVRRADPFEVLFDADGKLPQLRRAVPVEQLRHQDVLVDGHGVLQHAMYRDDVDANQLLTTFDPLHGRFTDVSDELHAQLPRFDATGAAAHVERDHPFLFTVERSVHRQRQLGDAGDDVTLSDGLVQERGVSLHFHQA